MTALFRRVLGLAFDDLPPTVRRVHGGPGLWRGWARARGAASAGLVRAAAGLKTGIFRDFSVEIAQRDGAEQWARQFGPSRFRSILTADREGTFIERLGPLGFHLAARRRGAGFDWLPLGWRLGPLPLPRLLMPRIRARSFERDGVYRFRVRISHPLCGLIIAYAGRLDASAQG